MAPIPSNYRFRTQPYRHQEIALERGWDRDHFGLLMEMGTGKSKIIVDNMFMLREAGLIDCALVVAPKGTYANWYDIEIKKHAPEHHLETVHMHLWTGGNTKKEKDELERMTSRTTDEFRIMIINIEAIVASLRGYDIIEKFVRSGRCMIIVDESSTIKNPQASRTKMLIRLSRYAPYRRIATGTPVTKSPLDLWSQFEFLKSSCLGHKSFFSFRARYAIVQNEVMQGRRVPMVVGHRNTEQLARLVAEHAVIARKEDCLDLPPKVYEKRKVILTPEQTKIYNDLKKWATSEIEAGRFVSATQAVTCLLRMHQVVCGHVTDESGAVADIPSNRLAVLNEVLDEIDDKTIVWCTYRRDVDQVMEAMRQSGRKAVRYDGGTNREERSQAIEQFQNGDADVFVGTPHAGGYGITLTAARAVVYYSNTYDLEKRLQSEDRAHRIGQTRSVTCIDLIAEGTVDEKIAKSLQAKEDLAAVITKGPARLKEFI